MKKCLITGCIILLLLLTSSGANAVNYYIFIDRIDSYSSNFTIPHISVGFYSIKMQIQSPGRCEVYNKTTGEHVISKFYAQCDTSGTVILQPGEYNIYAWQPTNGGNIKFKFSTMSNTDQITLKNDNYLTNAYTASPVRISWNMQSNRKYKIFNNGADITSLAENCSNGYIYGETANLSLEEGSYRLYVISYENEYNLPSPASNYISFTVDNTAPIGNSIYINNPGAQYANNPFVSIYLNGFYDNGSGINAVSFDYNESNPTWNNINMSNMTVPYIFFTGDGPKKIAAWVRDNVGNVSKPFQYEIILDTNPPEDPGTPTIDNQNGFSRAKSLRWRWEGVADNLSGVKRYWVYIDGDDGSTFSASTDSCYYDFAGIKDGIRYSCKVKAEDYAGNLSAISTASEVTVDHTAPAVELSNYPIRLNGNTAIFKWEAAVDLGSGIQSYEVALTGTLQNPDQVTPLEKNTTNGQGYAFNIKVNSNRVYYAWIRAVDYLGNKGDWTVNGPFPEFTISGPPDGTCSNKLAADFYVSSRVGKELAFEVGYMIPGDNNSIKYSSLNQTTINFLEGEWDWWIEAYEVKNGQIENDSKQISETFRLRIDTTPPPETANSFVIKSRTGERIYNVEKPANTCQVNISDFNLNDNPGGSGIKGVYLWNGISVQLPSGALYKSINEINDAGIPWELPDQDGVHQINMLIEDNAGNTTLVTYNVALDRVAPGMPQNITHSYSNWVMTFKWDSTEPNTDLAEYRGSYILPGGTEQPFSVTPAETKEGTYQIAVGLSANQPVIITIYAVDRATNESGPVSHTGCTPAEPGKLEYLETGYDTATNRHYLTWKLAEPGSAKTHKLEYGQTAGEGFIPILEITPSADGVFTHNATGTNPEDKLQPHATYQYRLTAYNQAEDRTYSPVFNQEVANLAPVEPDTTEFAPTGYASAKAIFDYPEVKDYDNDAVTYTVKWIEGSSKDLKAYHDATWDTELGKYRINLEPGKHGTGYSWYLEAKDSYGATTTSDIVQFNLDVNNPAITLEKPKSLYTNWKELKVSAKDDLSGIKNLIYQIGTQDPQTVQLTSGTDGELFGTIPLVEGKYNLKATVQDRAGNSVSEDVNNLWVDHTLPTLDNSSIVIDLPTKDGVYLTSGKIPVTWKANDSGSGIAGIRYWIMGSGEEPGQGIYITLSSGLTEYAHNLEIATNKVNDQNYHLALAVIDKAGNMSATYRLAKGFLLDITPPEVELTLTGLYPNGSSLYLTDLNNLQALLTVREAESGATGSFNLIDSATKTPVTTWYDWENVKQAVLTPGAKYRVAAKAVNGVGLETDVFSEEFIFDNSEPILYGLSGPTQALSTGESFILNVSATEYETSIDKYRVAIGTEPGATEFSALIPGNKNGWLEINTNSLQPQLRMETPEIADGVYQITLEAVNAAGLTARFNEERTLTVNNNQERIVVSDQGPYTMFAEQLTGWWKYNGTKIVAGYRFRVLDQNNQTVRDWQETIENMVTIDQLQLENGKTYRFEAQAIFKENLLSESGFSAGVTVDTTAPVITELKTPLYTAPNDFGFDWAGSDDCSGISRVLAAVGTDYNQTDVTKGWVEVAGNSVKLSRDANGEPIIFDLDNTKRYYLTLRLVNGAGLTAEKAAPGVVIDDTPPPAPVVFDQGGFINTKPEQPMEAHWFWSEPDPESGSRYQWTILKYGEKVNSLTQWQDGDDSKRISLTMDDFSREHGETYYFAVKATNGAGLSSIGYSDGIMADATAPYLLQVKVLDATNQSGAEEINYVTDSNKALRLWIDSYDPQSDVAYYLYAWNIPEEVDQAERSSSSEEPIIITNPNLVEGAINIFLGETVNQADITSPSGYSTGIVIDSEAPVIRNVRGGVSGDSLLFDWDVETSASPIVRYEYAFVKEAKVNSITADDWKIAEDKSIDRRLTLDAAAYPDGNYCLVVRGYNAAGTYSRRDAERQEWGVSNVITLDRTVPVITTAVFPKYADELIKISASAMDEGSGIDGYQYTVGTAANPFQFSGGWIDLKDQSSTVNIEIPTNIIPHNTGVYTMVRVKDKAGLWSTPKVSGKAVIDHTNPETPALAYGSYTTNKLLLTGIEYQATDPESGLTNYRLGLVTEIGGSWIVTKEEQVQMTSEGKSVKLNLAIAAPGLTEAGTYYVALQVQNGTGDWSEIGYSGKITVDSTKPALVFTKAGQTPVTNHPPFNLEYTLSEEAQVKVTVTGADGSAKEETITGINGVNQYTFQEAEPQIYTVTAIATDKAGNVGDGTEATRQTIRVNAPPVISLTGEIKATLGRPLTFKADVTDPDRIEGDSFTYEWFPGDGGTVLSGATPEYRYTALGEYTLTLTVTDKDGGKTTVTSLVKVGNTTSGTLCMDETWSGSHRIYGDVIVPAGMKLTIQPGTEIIIDGIPGETGYNHALIVRGTLNAQTGTGFTSVTGTVGCWRGILVEGEATLEGVIIRYAERGVTALDGSKVTLTGCNFENNLAGVHAYGSSPSISNCLFKNNVYGIKEDASGRPVVTGCRFTDNGIDYYHLELTEINMEQLNGMPGNRGNSK